MAITTEQYEKITRFLDADMDLAEMEAFEKELAANPEMRRQLDFEQSVRNEFASQELPDVIGMTTEEAPVARQMTRKTTRLQKWLVIGAAAAVLAAVLVITKQNSSPKPAVADKIGVDTTRKEDVTPPVAVIRPAEDSSRLNFEALFKQYFKKDSLPDEYPLFLAEAFTDYASGKYSTLQQLSLKELPEVRGIDGNDSKEKILQLAHYYKGLAFLQTNDTRQAAINLEWALNNHADKTLRAKAQWYLALTYLKEGKKEKAAVMCRNIISNKENTLVIKNAEKLLDRIKE